VAPDTGRPGRLVPRDAATLLLLDRTPGGLHVLMGRRRGDLAFQPGSLVFPGGRVDPADGDVPAVADLPDRLRDRLMDRMRRRPSRRRARGLVAAAIRETAEETGYLLGRPDAGPVQTMPAGWSAFASRGVAVDLSAFALVGRAITPVNRPRRFDARFFAAFADRVVASEPSGPQVDGELDDVRFVRVADAPGLGIPTITAIMLMELENRLSADPRLETDHPAPFYVPTRSGHRREEI
jgi:8-oxo-dGTP pyrophosphatase MutT (NUDIX family)